MFLLAHLGRSIAALFLGFGVLTSASAPLQTGTKVVSPPSRYKVIGPTDPATGIHIEYSVSSIYLSKKDDRMDWEFTSKEQGKIIQTNSKHAHVAGQYVDSRGYVRIDMKREKKIIMGGVNKQESREVNGCPTTFVIEDSDIVVNDHVMQYYILFVRPRKQSVIYIFQTTGIEGMPNPDLLELKAIRESIRVVK